MLVHVILIVTCAFSSSAMAQNEQPNVVFFLVDDLGWVDTAVNGSKIYQTPNIDKLARQGMSFSSAYSTHPLCIGARYGIMTGKYPAKIKKSKFGTMHPKEITMADAFKAQGYETFFAGKWHLGKENAYPEHQGFDVNIGGHDKGAPADYFYPYGKDDSNKKVPGLDKLDKQGDYLTDSLTEKANAFIDNNKHKPFLVYLSHYGVHVPIQAKEDDINQAKTIIEQHEFIGPKYTELGPAKQKMHQDNPGYAAMVKSIDDSLGSLMANLEKHNLTNKTIVIFTSDNGGESTKTTAYGGKATSNLPLKAGKCWLYEGGIRVPLIVKWPHKIKANSTSEHSVTGTDFYPTLMELANLSAFPQQHLDGRSFASELLGVEQLAREPMFWSFPAGGHLSRVCGTKAGTAINDGRYKMINWYKQGKYELYDLHKDIGEERNLAGKETAIEKRLLKQVEQWQKDMSIK